ncbi:MAG: acyl-CoA synthetase [Gammaproteobacteria bacterium]|nr:MAG: acyl-CoA synthetase [Gammaproteobacteria bacterium]
MSPAKIINDINDIRALEYEPWSERSPAVSTYEFLSNAASHRPDKYAITFLPTGALDEEPVRITYKQLIGKITQAANMFSDLGAGPSDTISMLLPLLPQAQYTLWGAEAAGIVNPINYLLNPGQIIELLNAAKTKILVALGPTDDSDIWQKVEEIRDQIPTLEVIIQVNGSGDKPNGVYPFDETLKLYPADKLTSGRKFSADDIASYLHTGGTTGSPKLAQHTHGGQVWQAWAAAVGSHMDETGVLALGLPLFHVAGAFHSSLAPLCHGTEIIMLSPSGMRNPLIVENYWKLVEKYKVTSTGGIPTSYVALNKVPVADADISSIEFGIAGGMHLPIPVQQEFLDKTGKNLINVYGATEATGVFVQSPMGNVQIGTVGIRLPYVELKIVKPGTLQTSCEECKVNEIGVVIANGPFVFPGYLEEAHNQDVFTKDGWLNLGDLGYLDENEVLYLTGRAKDLIIRSGHNIDPSVIEDTVVKHPAVAMAAAVGKPDEYAGEKPVVYVQLHPEATANTEEILSYITENISERPAIPEVIITKQLPMTAVGKIFKPQLRWEQIKLHFNEILSELEKYDIKISVEVGEHKVHGTLCKIFISGAPTRRIKDIDDEITTTLAKYQFIKSEIHWSNNDDTK